MAVHGIDAPLGHTVILQLIFATYQFYNCIYIVVHIVNLRPLTKLEGGLQSPHKTGDDAVYWKENVATTAFAK